MNIDEARLACLRLAHEQHSDSGDEGRVVEVAQTYADFVLGTKDGEIVQAAKRLSEAVQDAA